MNANGTFQTEAIQNVAVGQDVLTRNANDPSGPLQEEAVTQVFVHTVYSLREVTIREADGSVQTIATTDSHPFYVQGMGFVAAADLHAGDALTTDAGIAATVVGTTSQEENGGVQVYNFTVALDHTYFVQAGTGLRVDAVCVHNDCLQDHRGTPKSMGGKYCAGTLLCGRRCPSHRAERFPQRAKRCSGVVRNRLPAGRERCRFGQKMARLFRC